MNTTPDFAVLFVKMLVGLVLILGLGLVFIRYVLPRTALGRRQRPGTVEILSRIPLEARKSLWIVKVVERYLLLGASDNSLNLITELSQSEGEKIEGNTK